MFQPATYVTIWDGVSSVRTHCEIDLSKVIPAVRNIEAIDDTEGLFSLDEEYVEINGEKILTFCNLDTNGLIQDGWSTRDL